MEAIRDYPVNRPTQPQACGSTAEVSHRGVVVWRRVCDLPAGHLGMHANGIDVWGRDA